MKKRSFDFKGLRFNIWFYFIVYALLIVMILWLFQIVIMPPVYEVMKKRDLLKTGSRLADSYSVSEAKFDELAKSTVADNDILIVLFSSEKVKIYTSRGEGGRPSDIIGSESMLIFFNELAKSDGRVEYTERNESGVQTLVYGAAIGGENQATLYMTSILEPVATTARVLKNQLFIVTIFLLIIGFLVSFFASVKLGKPISEISAQAKKLGAGDFSARFSAEGYTEIEELSDTLNYAAGELQKTDELRKELMANVSHDLRTPLTMVKAYAEMIRDISGNDPEKREKHTAIIIQEADRLSLLVNDILNLSRLERGNIPMNLEEFNLSELVETAAAHFSYLAEKEGYRFKLDVQPDLFVKADRARMEQVVYNLVSNAVNYTGDDRIVKIRVWQAGAAVRFEVTDTGAGIPEDALKGIWDRYYRSKETHKRPVVGTGLGLSIVKNILVAHGAAFGVVSSVGAGSTFWFEFPAV